MRTHRRHFLVGGGLMAFGALGIAMFRRFRHAIDAPLEPFLPKVRPKTSALAHEPFDAAALAVLAALVDDLIPGDRERGLPSASEASVLGYVVRAAREPGFSAVRDDVLKLCRHVARLSIAEFGGRYETLSSDARARILDRIARDDEPRGSFRVDRALELTLRLSLEGYFGHPHHGGNRDAIAWDAFAIAMPRDRGATHAHGAHP